LVLLVLVLVFVPALLQFCWCGIADMRLQALLSFMLSKH
jgi:hypothetical protein